MPKEMYKTKLSFDEMAKILKRGARSLNPIARDGILHSADERTQAIKSQKQYHVQARQAKAFGRLERGEPVQTEEEKRKWRKTPAFFKTPLPKTTVKGKYIEDLKKEDITPKKKVERKPQGGKTLKSVAVMAAMASGAKDMTKKKPMKKKKPQTINEWGTEGMKPKYNDDGMEY